jgi:hypothetical protein
MSTMKKPLTDPTNIMTPPPCRRMAKILKIVKSTPFRGTLRPLPIENDFS